MSSKVKIKTTKRKAKTVTGMAANMVAISDFGIEEASKLEGVYERYEMGYFDEGKLVMYIKTNC